MKVALRLTYDQHAQRQASAWFVVGRTAEEWFAELTAWPGPLGAARCYVVPTSPRVRAPCGLLVVGASPAGGKPSPRALPYGAAAGRLYLPVEARLEPDVSEQELDALLGVDADDGLLGFGDDAYFWHPHAGLLALSRASTVTVADLLHVDLPTADAWDAAVPGVALNGRLTSIEPTVVPRVEDVLSQGRGDIGTQAPTLEKLPEAPGEPSTGALAAGGRALGEAIANAAKWFAEHMPQGTGRPGWMNSLENWANQKLNDLADSLQASRNRELLRLMNLLKNNPDEGLRFALPMGGGEHRGTAPPSNQLGRRDVNFSLGNLRGGGPADFWDMPPDFQRELINRYRELAARELALGRHRRAAYIFASLLGDLRSAANALIDGGHWREAAVIFEQRLNQPLEAARCLRQGRLWAEAIALYERLGQFEIVGDIYAELEQPAEADAAWRRAVEVRLDAADVLGAAKILERKLHRDDEAFEHLLAAWPHSKQASACLTECFALLARHQTHEEAGLLVTRLADVGRHPESVASLVEILAVQAGEYPQAGVREHAADIVRVLSADRLAAAGLADDEARRLVHSVQRLVPQDRLLERDGRRFLQRRKQPAPAKPASRAFDRLKLGREFWLPQLAWTAAAATYDALFVAGWRDRELVVMRTDWNGSAPEESVGMKWEYDPAFVGEPIVLVADPYGSAPLVVHVPRAEPLKSTRWFKASDRFPEPLAVGPHRGLSANTYGLYYSARETLHVADWSAGPDLVVNAFIGKQDHLGGLTSIALHSLPTSYGDWTVPWPMVVLENVVCVGLGRALCFTKPHGSMQTLELPEPVTQLITSPPQTRIRIVAAMQRGGMIFWGDGPDAPRAPFASEMESPQITLTRDGSLVAASQDEIDVYSTRDGKLHLRARAVGPGWKPIAALAPRHVNRFALVAPDGRIAVYDLPS